MSGSQKSEEELMSVFGPSREQVHIEQRLRGAGWTGEPLDIELSHPAPGGTLRVSFVEGAQLSIHFETTDQEGHVRVQPGTDEDLDEALDLIVRWQDRLSAETWDAFLDDVARLRAPAFLPRKRNPDESVRLRTRAEIERDL